MNSFLRKYLLLSIVTGVIIIGLILELLSEHTFAKILLTASSLIVALKLSYDMIETLRSGRVGIDILAVAAILSTLVVGEYWAAIVVVLMLTGGESLEQFASRRARKELSALLDRAPQIAHRVVSKNKTETVQILSIVIGDMLLIRPQEVIPTDAVLLSDFAECDESSLTGESLPAERKKGDELLSGSVNLSGAITVKVMRTARDSQYQKIIDLVASAANSEAPFVRLADRYSIPFTIISFVIAGIAWYVSGDPIRFAEVLVLATPCPLLLATPVALISGMSRSARAGIIIKSGAILEKLARIQTVAFDKTGTLTKGDLAVASILPAQGYTKKQLLELAASAEQHSLHTLVSALITEATQQHITLHEPTSIDETVGHGISATVRGQKVLVGKATFLKDQKVKLGDSTQASNQTSVWVAIDGVYAGQITFQDIVRVEARDTITRLRALGVDNILMLTGDERTTAERIASEIGVTDIRAGLLPEDKVSAIKGLTARPVMMVGDGVNDTPVLASADVGVAMGARGSTAASETADVVVLVDDISKSWQAIMIARRTISVASQGIWIGMGLSIILMLIATTGVIPALFGAMLQEAVDVLVIFNALRAHSARV